METQTPVISRQIWQVGALCRAIADTLQARFNPVTVCGELSGFTRSSSGHCYFTLKDDSGQLRCAMFRRANLLLGFIPSDGELVEIRGRLDIYGPRGELQLIAESMSRAGQGNLFERFLQIKTKLEGEGLFEVSRKREIPANPRAIGVVTSLDSAALQDVIAALQRRVPHTPVVVANALVQGLQAPAALMAALSDLYALIDKNQSGGQRAAMIDVILLVRGGGAYEDLWAFNDERLARFVAESPVPVISGVGHETDFTIADFVADARAPTPTAAAELAAQARDELLAELAQARHMLQTLLVQTLDRQHQQVDEAAARMGRPTGRLALEHARLDNTLQHLTQAYALQQERQLRTTDEWASRLLQARTLLLERAAASHQSLAQRLAGVDPHQVLRRGYAWLMDASGSAVSSVAAVQPGQRLGATLADGVLAVAVEEVSPLDGSAR